MNIEEKDLKKYLEDLATIKKTVANLGEKPYVDPWMYFAWGLIIGIASVCSYLVSSIYSMDLRHIMLFVWLPMICIGGFLEFFSAARLCVRENRPLFTDSMVRFMLSFLNYFIFAGIAVYILAGFKGAPLAALFLLFGNTPVVFIAQMSYSAFFVNGYLGLAAGLVLFFWNPSDFTGFVFAVVFTVLNFFVMAAMSYFIEKKKRTSHE